MRMILDDPLVIAIFETTPKHHGLAREVVAEIFAEQHSQLHHGRRHAANKGCKGPLCRKALRDAQRKRLRDAAERTGGSVRPKERSLDLVEVDIELARIQLAYDKTAEDWKRCRLDRVHTALLIKPILSEWEVRRAFHQPVPIMAG